MSTTLSLRLFQIHSFPRAYWLLPSFMLMNILISSLNNLIVLLWLWYVNPSTNIPTQTRLQNEDSYSSFGGYSLAPNMAVPILTFVLPISICKIRVSWLKNIMTNHNTYPFIVSHVFSKGEKWFLTACSKSPVMPMDSSHCVSDIPRALQTSLLQLDSVWRVQKNV